LTVALAIWAMPWVSVGMTRHDYSPRVVAALLLAMGSTLMWLAAAFTWGLAGADRQLVEILHSLLGRRARLRNRHQFYNRLARECRRARRERRSSLSLVLVRLSTGEDCEGKRALEHVAHALMAAVRSSDVVGIAGDSEIGILAIGAGGKALEIIGARLRRALAAALAELSEDAAAPSVPEASLGVSTLGPDATEPVHLLVAARASFAPVAPRLRKAA
jgi:GGDEF domain-containing protein